MKSIGIPNCLHDKLKQISDATGKMHYRLIDEALDYLEEKYKFEIKVKQEKKKFASYVKTLENDWFKERGMNKNDTVKKLETM